MRYAEDRWGSRWGQEATLAYFEELQVPPQGAELQLFLPWLVHHWEVEGRPVREWFLEEREARLTPEDAEWLRCQRTVLLTVWEVLEVQPGVGLRVRHLLGREEHFVQEVLGSRQLVPRDAVLGRLVVREDATVFCGLYPRPLPPLETDELIRSARRELRARGRQPVPREKLATARTALGLIQLWQDQVSLLDEEARQPLHLRNTDGEPFVIVVDHYQLAPRSRPRVVERLQAFEGAEWEEAEGTLLFTFTKEGNAMHTSWDNTIIGSAQLQARALRLESNSENRADALRRRVEAACPGLLTHRTREKRGLEDLRGPPSRPEPTPPELLAPLREFKARHYAAWLDTKLPVLRGLSPREAVSTAAGRLDVGLMLKMVENTEAHQPAEERLDLTGLRRELGLEE